MRICDIESGDPSVGMLHTYYSTRFRACTYKTKLRTFDIPLLKNTYVIDIDTYHIVINVALVTKFQNLHQILSIVFIDEVEEIKRRITDEAGGRVCNTTLDPDTEAINDI